MHKSVWKQEPIEEYKLFQKKFPQLSNEFTKLVGKTFEESKLGRKTQELIIMTLLADKFEDGFKFHLKEAMKCGATKEEVTGAILMLLNYGSITTFLKALTWAEEETEL